MQEFAIATGAKRTSKVWKTEQWTLEALIQRLRDPVVTAESMAEYAAMDKDERDARKDVGGYVGGALKDKSRGSGHVQWRSMLTLDLDNIDVSTAAAMQTIAQRCPYTYILHPTHSHRPDVPRLRLIVPLETNVTEDQYEPIARRVAADIDISWFDPTTFQASRLMYWPSVPVDLDYDAVFTVHDGPLCSGSAMLNRYTDWRNIGEWPGATQVAERMQHRAKQQQDPREKQGPVGTFCRAYSIEDVLSVFLSDEYAPTDKPNRYTYTAGSTMGGLVLYDGIFAYDNHATSPASGMLCNAFDLVRVHKFGAEDEGSRIKDPAKMPSYLAMLNLMESDDRVKQQRAADLKERQEAVETEFDYEDAKKNWREALKYDKYDKVAPTINNVFLILTNDPNFKGKLYTDVFSERDVVEDTMPWTREKHHGVYRDWSDADTEQLRRYLENEYDGLTKKDIIESGLVNAFQAQSRHPVREYLQSLPEWDGTERVESLLVDYLGADNTEYVRTVTKIHVVAAVARVMNPGVKYETMITISGGQGTYKSSFIRLLSGDHWFTDNVRDFGGKDKDVFLLLQGAWMVEVAELVAYDKAKEEEFKAFLSKQDDTFRLPFGRRTGKHPRQCVFWGTTNQTQFLKDITGERRMWPVDIDNVPRLKDVFTDLPEERDQIWAEALHYYEQGTPLYLSPEMEGVAEEVRGSFREDDDRKELIEEFLEKDITDNWKDLDLNDRRDYLNGDIIVPNAGNPCKREKVTSFEIWVECFNKNVNERFPRGDNLYITNIMSNMPGWKTVRTPIKLDNKVYSKKQKKLYFMRKSKK